jgi:threonine synthase
MVSDDEIIAAYGMLASAEGVFCEPASAASIAGVIKKAKDGFFEEASRIVCTLTGHGLKDPDNAIKASAATTTCEPLTCEAELKKVLDVLGI